MAKRVSMKGKGADIFFGEYARDEAPAPETSLREVPAPAANDSAVVSAGEHASSLASTLASELASHHGAEPQPASEAPKQTVRNARRGATTKAQPSTPPPDELRTMLVSELVFYREAVIEQIRRTVKAPGREVSYIRLTPEEKAQLAKIVYGFRSRGKKTTENEINRIAVNFLLLDYQANGEESLLVKVIDALLA